MTEWLFSHTLWSSRWLRLQRWSSAGRRGWTHWSRWDPQRGTTPGTAEGLASDIQPHLWSYFLLVSLWGEQEAGLSIRHLLLIISLIFLFKNKCNIVNFDFWFVQPTVLNATLVKTKSNCGKEKWEMKREVVVWVHPPTSRDWHKISNVGV